MKRIGLIIILIISVLMFSCSTTSKNSVEDRLDKQLKAAFKSHAPGVSMIAIQNGKTVYKQAFGLANVELNVPMSADMLFKLGSISKQFTAISILLLEEQGQLSTEDPITKYFDNLSTEYKDVKIKHLLSHTSGIRNYNGMDVWKQEIRNPITPEEQMDMFIHEPLWFDPGEKWSYSNSGYNLLSQIIEKVSGQEFETFVKEQIFTPAGMKHSYYANDEDIIPGLVKGYRVDDDGFKVAEYMSMSHTVGGGDVISSVDDLARWNKALVSGKIISEVSFKKSLESFVLNDGSKAHYGMGWFMEPYRNMINYYHGGGVYGFVSHSMYIPEEDLYIVVLRNCVDLHTKLPAYVIGNMIADVVLGYDQENEEERVAIDLDESQLQCFVGTYQFVESPGKRKIELIDGKLHYRRPPREGEIWSKTAINPMSMNEFFVPGKKSTLLFIRSGEGDITGLHVNQAFGRVVKLTKISNDL